MNQQELHESQGATAQDDDFDKGFGDGADGQPASMDDATSPEPAGDRQEPDGAPTGAVEPAVQQPAGSRLPEPAGEPLAEPAPGEDSGPAPSATGDADEPEQVSTMAVPEELADELEALKRLNPQAAALALEDSKEGESIRLRLAELGALQAQDRAESILERRERLARAAQAEEARSRQAVEAHNRRFMAVLQRDHPDYTAMLSDPARKVEAARAMQDIFSWISAKPYAEAAPLMEIARHGRDPEQVSALITRYKQEQHGKAAPKKAGPEGAFAVPARGATSAPSGDEGNADDFDAGFNLE